MNCSISVCLLVVGENLDPDEISSFLGVNPTKGWKRGQERKVGSRGRTHVYPWGGWKLVDSADCIDKAHELVVKMAKIGSPLSESPPFSFEFDSALEMHFFGVPEAPFPVSPEVLGLIGDIPIKISSH